MKLLLWVVLIVIALLVLRLVNIAAAKRRNQAAGTSRKAARADDMVRCVRCGVYIPSADAKRGPKGMTCGEPACLEQR
jgi:uncharacterized protein